MRAIAPPATSAPFRLAVRRVVIVALLLLGYLYFHHHAGGPALVSINERLRGN